MRNEEIETNRRKAYDLLGQKCLMCSHGAVTIHEIVPRSKRPKDWWEIDNLVPLCAECHEEIHKHGAMRYVDELRGLRLRRLASLR